MGKLLVFAALGVLAWKLIVGRWPWEPKRPVRAQAVERARRLLGLTAAATREDVIAAHRRLVAAVHPDRGGSNGQVHEANAARDMLLDDLTIHQEPR